MNKILPGFATEQAARIYSMQRYPNITDAITEYAFAWKKNPDADEWGLIIPDEYQHFLPNSRLADLIDDTWFPVVDIPPGEIF